MTDIKYMPPIFPFPFPWPTIPGPFNPFPIDTRALASGSLPPGQTPPIIDPRVLLGYCPGLPPWQSPPIVPVPGDATRGVVAQPGPLSPGDFGLPVPPQEMARSNGQGQPLTQAEKAVLRQIVGVLREARAAKSGVEPKALVLRVTMALGYLSGFLEAKGFAQLGDFVRNLPSAAGHNPQEDILLDDLTSEIDKLINPSDTRIVPLVAFAIGVASSVVGNYIYDKWVK